MSICTCKGCGKIFDSDFEINEERNGNPCCDFCFETLILAVEAEMDGCGLGDS